MTGYLRDCWRSRYVVRRLEIDTAMEDACCRIGRKLVTNDRILGRCRQYRQRE